MMTAAIRTMTGADVAPVSAVMRLCGVEPWPDDGIRDAVLAADSVTLVAVDKEGIIGFLLARLITSNNYATQCSGSVSESEIHNIGVLPAHRRRGIAGALIASLIARCPPATEIFLEVREGNSGARRFYERLGFAEIGRRRGFYRDPHEDAVTMMFRTAAGDGGDA